MNTPLIELRNIERRFCCSELELTVLADINLEIHQGEMVAIVGSSGSGKSTLLNILGALDKPSRGEYTLRGRNIMAMDASSLARLRRAHCGFIFQRYHLLPHLDARANVEIPAIYRGIKAGARKERAGELLCQLGLADRLSHTPGQLSGGQQQRVSIARALINGGEIILADEPTGALDSQSSLEVMEILTQLKGLGHTVILVTHDPEVAAYADRIVELKDGRIVRDSGSKASDPPQDFPQERAEHNTLSAWWWRLYEAFTMALHTMASHRLRTGLTMLGIIIGIAAVVTVVALGKGAQQQVIDDIKSMGTNTIEIFPGKDWGDERAHLIKTLNEQDFRVLEQQPYLDSVSPVSEDNGLIRYGNKERRIRLVGVAAGYSRVKGMKVVRGRFFAGREIRQRASVVVINERTAQKLFGNEDPLGRVMVFRQVPLQVIGVVQDEKSFFSDGKSLMGWLPYSAMMSRMRRTGSFERMIVRVKEGVAPSLAEEGLVELLSRRHGTKDFFTFSSDKILNSVQKTTRTMTLLVSSIAVISLVVGGIGVMNIMLVSVVERTKEIGIRVAVGARQSDILQQFLLEAVMVTVIGGGFGVGLSLLIGCIFSLFTQSITMQFSPGSIVAAFVCSSLIGILFGFLPARNAARLDPVIALERE
ncbi:MacB family efflux pump subunit [Desulfogranum mediterraneum]|uniref:MacB family efflux pump subunit n=1 Tax=Desulfogranum mediterraneum TaxID=160661 RepID=UPI0003FACCCD|nr:MacB family efflux pump subunit [Desulfogranum mediterraneum]